MSVAYFPAQTSPPSTMGNWQDPGPHTRSQVVANSCYSIIGMNCEVTLSVMISQLDQP